MGHGIHQMDLALSILGDWTEVTAVMSTLERDTETEDVSMAIVRLASGGLLSIVNSLLSPRETSFLRFDFDDATVELEHVYGYDNSHWRWTPAAHAAGDAQRIATWETDGRRAGLASRAADALVDAMERGERPAASGADGRRVLELIAGMYASTLTRRTVRREELTPEHPFVSRCTAATRAEPPRRWEPDAWRCRMPEFALEFWADAVTASVDDDEIGTYVFAPDAVASESPKPYWHPLRTLDGGLVTGYRRGTTAGTRACS
jgi:hypothetical protein